MIRNIVFDMGNVLIHWEPQDVCTHRDVAAEDWPVLLREVFRSVEWVQMDRGTLSPEQALEIFRSRLPRRLLEPVRETVTGWWKEHLFPIPGMGELVTELKANGYGIYLLSNASKDLRSYFPRIPGAEHFDGLLVSAEVKLLKPQHEIYEALYRAFGLRPEECFFIDDVPANVEGALVTGMHGTIFRKDVPALRRTLIRNGIRCAP